jgi:hypothetical protein
MVTGSIATFFVDRLSKKDASKSVYDEQVEYLKSKLDELDNMSIDDVKSLQSLTFELWNQKQKKHEL